MKLIIKWKGTPQRLYENKSRRYIRELINRSFHHYFIWTSYDQKRNCLTIDYLYRRRKKESA